MELRLARPDELDAVGEITLAAYEDFTTGTEDFYRQHLRDAARRAREAELWVAVDGDAVLGTVTYCPPDSPWRELAGDDEGEFRMLAVDPAHQNRGAGHALVAHCEGRARDHGATGMVLSSLAEMAAAHRVYLRHGYARAPERDWSPVDDVHLIAFTKELP
jgi:GNAT superfamily N-acetyltransferase